MLRSLNLKVLGTVVLSLGLALSSCDKDKAPDDSLASSQTTSPAEPPSLSDSSDSVQRAGANNPVYFAFDSSELSSETQAKLNGLADHLKTKSAVSVQIAGHCDERGTNEYNLALGERRALAVKRYLETMGVEGKRLTTISFGEEKPAVQGHTEEAWAKNRRAEFDLSE